MLDPVKRNNSILNKNLILTTIKVFYQYQKKYFKAQLMKAQNCIIQSCTIV